MGQKQDYLSEHFQCHFCDQHVNFEKLLIVAFSICLLSCKVQLHFNLIVIFKLFLLMYSIFIINYIIFVLSDEIVLHLLRIDPVFLYMSLM